MSFVLKWRLSFSHLSTVKQTILSISLILNFVLKDNSIPIYNDFILIICFLLCCSQNNCAHKNNTHDLSSWLLSINLQMICSNWNRGKVDYILPSLSVITKLLALFSYRTSVTNIQWIYNVTWWTVFLSHLTHWVCSKIFPSIS